MFTPLSGLEGAAVPALSVPLGPAAAAMGAMILALLAVSTLVLLLVDRRTAPHPHARSRTPSTPTFPAQLNVRPPHPTVRPAQWAQTSSTVRVAQSRLSRIRRSAWAATSKASSLSF